MRSLVKFDYKSFIVQPSNVLFHPFNDRPIHSPTKWLHDLSFLQEMVRERCFIHSNFGCPWQPMAFAKLSPLHFSAFFSSLGALVILLPPFITKHQQSMSNPLVAAGGSQYGAIRLSASLLEKKKGNKLQFKKNIKTSIQRNSFFFLSFGKTQCGKILFLLWQKCDLKNKIHSRNPCYDLVPILILKFWYFNSGQREIKELTH